MRPALRLLLLVLLSGCNQSPSDLQVHQVSEDGLRAQLISRPENWQNPIVVLIPGSSKGYIKGNSVYELVRSGYDVYSIAYHGLAGLPSRIQSIPVEYVHRCIAWLRGNALGKSRKLVVLGLSRGSELALLYAQHFGDVDGVICYAPSSLVLPDHVGYPEDQPYKSSWSISGRDLPFAPIDRFEDPAGKITYKKYLEPWIDHLHGAITVDKIICPVLLMAGADDMVWPAAKMAANIEAKIMATPNGTWIRSVVYAQAGHQFFYFEPGPPAFTATSQSLNLTGIKKHRFLFGGSEQGNKNAMIKSRQEVFDFLQMIKNQ